MPEPTSPGVTTPPDPLAGKELSSSSTLSPWAAPAVTDFMARAEAYAKSPYQEYTGPLTAGESDLQKTAFQGLSSLTIPTDLMKAYTPRSFTDEGVASKYMNPFLEQVLDPQRKEAERAAGIKRLENLNRFTRPGGASAFGGSRQAIMEAEGERNLATLLDKITGEGYKNAYDTAAKLFGSEEDRALLANRQAQDFGLAALRQQLLAGETQRGIESEGIKADIAQFEKEIQDPQKKLEFQQKMFQNLPISTTTKTYQGPSDVSTIFGDLGAGLVLADYYKRLFGG